MQDRAQVHYLTHTVNAYGERVESWSSLGTFWAETKYMDLRSKEQELAGQETARRAVQFTIRNTGVVNETMRVYAGQRLYDIESISVSNDRQYITLTCKQYDTGALTTPEGGEMVGNTSYLETFTGITGNTVTVTVYGGNISDNKARVFVTVNGNETQSYSIAGSDIVLDWELVSDDFVTVRFFV
jgi:SPP1 family predicted phage head-tail adaptor